MAKLLPWLKARFLDANGVPLAGGKLYSYVAGSATPLATYTDDSEVTPNANPVVLDANGEADIWIPQVRNYKFILADADDVVIWTRDNVSIPGSSSASTGIPDGGSNGSVFTKFSDNDGDAEWRQYAYSGYSATFNAPFSSTDLDDTISKILNFQYTAPLISLAASGSGTIREKGASVSSTTLTATVTKKSDPIAVVRFYQAASLLSTKTGTIPTGGTETHSYATPFTDTISFSAQVDDNGATGGPTTVTSNTVTFTFVYPYYYGAGASGKTAAQVAALSKDVIVSTATVTKTISASNGNVFYFAYPASYGALTSILDVNGFETLPDWTASTSNITGLDGNAVSYRIYEFKNPVVAGLYQYTFKR